MTVLGAEPRPRPPTAASRLSCAALSQGVPVGPASTSKFGPNGDCGPGGRGRILLAPRSSFVSSVGPQGALQCRRAPAPRRLGRRASALRGVGNLPQSRRVPHPPSHVSTHPTRTAKWRALHERIRRRIYGQTQGQEPGRARVPPGRDGSRGVSRSRHRQAPRVPQDEGPRAHLRARARDHVPRAVGRRQG